MARSEQPRLVVPDRGDKSGSSVCAPPDGIARHVPSDRSDTASARACAPESIIQNVLGVDNSPYGTVLRRVQRGGSVRPCASTAAVPRATAGSGGVVFCICEPDSSGTLEECARRRAARRRPPAPQSRGESIATAIEHSVFERAVVRLRTRHRRRDGDSIDPARTSGADPGLGTAVRGAAVAADTHDRSCSSHSDRLADNRRDTRFEHGGPRRSLRLHCGI